MHARCARKVEKSFEKVTFYSLEEAIGRCSKGLASTMNQTNLPNMMTRREVASKEVTAIGLYTHDILPWLDARLFELGPYQNSPRWKSM